MIRGLSVELLGPDCTDVQRVEIVAQAVEAGRELDLRVYAPGSEGLRGSSARGGETQHADAIERVRSWLARVYQIPGVRRVEILGGRGLEPAFPGPVPTSTLYRRVKSMGLYARPGPIPVVVLVLPR